MTGAHQQGRHKSNELLSSRCTIDGEREREREREASKAAAAAVQP